MDSPDAVIREISSAFLAFDTGSKGYLTRHEVRAVHLSLLGYEPSLLELEEILPRQPPGQIEPVRMELPQLCEVMARRMCAQDVDETIRRAFRAFDPSHKGFISRRDLLQVMSRVAPHLSERTTELVFSQVDEDADGKVSYKDFHTMMGASGVGGRKRVCPPPARSRVF